MRSVTFIEKRWVKEYVRTGSCPEGKLVRTAFGGEFKRKISFPLVLYFSRLYGWKDGMKRLLSIARAKGLHLYGC